MIVLLSTMVPILGLIALGFAAVKGRIITAPGVRGLILFVFTFSLPAYLLVGLADLEIPPRLGWGFLVAYLAGSAVAYGIGMAWARLGFAKPLPDQAIFGMLGSYSNIVVGIPVVLGLLGPEASLWLFLLIGVHSVAFLPPTVVMLDPGEEGRRGVGGRLLRAAGQAVANPVILGIAAGLALALSGASLPPGADALLRLLGAAAIPCALFAMGGSLADSPLRGSTVPAGVLALVKLVVHPAAVWLVADRLMGLDGEPVVVAVVLAAMPGAVNTYLFGARYGASPDVAAKTVFVTVIASIVSVWALLSLLGT